MFRFIRHFILSFLIFSSSSFAVHLADIAKEYEVRFTNPICKEYRYAKEIRAQDGSWLKAKPKNVFCTFQDKNQSHQWNHSPEFKLKGWIDSAQNGDRIFFAYYSISSSTIVDALCSAARRGVRIQFFLDSSQEQEKANELDGLNCQSQKYGDRVQKYTGGWSGKIGNAHNKVFLYQKKGDSDLRISFSSGNLSSGVVLHHENWHFVTVPVASFFSLAHLCLKDAILDHAQKSIGRWEYAQQIAKCKASARQKYPEETDIRTFFIPGEGEQATQWMLRGIRASERVDVAAHRFSHYPMVHDLRRKLGQDPKSVRIVVDDDLWWVGQGEEVGPNQEWEWEDRLFPLIQKGAQARYMETNHGNFLLHHNKFLIFNTPQESDKTPAVFTGAANLTDGGFFMWKWSIQKDGPTQTQYPYNTNLENVYFITIPQVVKAFQNQYRVMWERMATPQEKLPRENTLPTE